MSKKVRILHEDFSHFASFGNDTAKQVYLVHEEGGGEHAEGGDEGAEQDGEADAELVREDARDGREEEGGADGDGADEGGLSGRVGVVAVNLLETDEEDAERVQYGEDDAVAQARAEYHNASLTT